MAASHLKVSMSPTDHRFVDDLLRKGGRTRTVAVNVPHWLVVPQVLRETDLITVIPERIARRMGGDTLTWRRLPFTSAGFEWRLYRHRRHDGGRALDWLCTRIREAAHGIA
jgi:DNA-binding transcriptional LysR family regulator